MIKKIIKWFNSLFKTEHKPVITQKETEGCIYVYSDGKLIIRATIFPLRDKAMIEKVSNLFKLI